LALVAIAKVGADIDRPLIGFGQDKTVRVVGINGGADGLDDAMGLGKVLAGGAVAFDQVGDGVYAQRVDAMSSQKRMALRTSSITIGLSKLRSGWWEKKRCQ